MSIIDFDQLLVTNAEFLKPFAVTLTKDQESAKDLVQETMFRALDNKEKYNVGTNIKAWLYTIMRNVFINDYRKKARQNTILDTTPNEFLLDYNQTFTRNNAETTIQFKEIIQAVNHLPDIFKKPFLLYFEGYKYHELAGMLQEPLGTIKSRIHFARKILKNQIERY